MKDSLLNIVNDNDIKQLIKKDPLFESINAMYGPPPNWTRPQGFSSLARIILEQQVSLASANAHYLRLNNYLNGFTPANILSLTDDEMRQCQISRQKAKYLRALSAAILNYDLNLEELPKLDEAEIRRKLTAIKGIGEWTADIYLMFCLQSKNIFPTGDVAVVNTIKELGHIVSKEEMVKLAEKWTPFRSLAAYFLWHYY